MNERKPTAFERKLAITDAVDQGRSYLLSKIKDGICCEFPQLRHGASWAWSTACIGSALAEFNSVPPEMVGSIVDLQDQKGGWAYNRQVPSDADSTLRVLQFLKKVGFTNKDILKRAEQFILSHQNYDGGFATYRVEAMERMGYQGRGWTLSHPCVTALALNVISDKYARSRAKQFINRRLAHGDARAYWWTTPLYVLYEIKERPRTRLTSIDSVELSLRLLLEAKFGRPNIDMVTNLLELRLSDGSFQESHVFRIPRPHQSLSDITEQEEVVEDKKRTFATAAAIVALSRQRALLG